MVVQRVRHWGLDAGYRLAPFFLLGTFAGVFGSARALLVLLAAALAGLLLLSRRAGSAELRDRCLRTLPPALLASALAAAGLWRAAVVAPDPLPPPFLEVLADAPLEARVRSLGGAATTPNGLRVPVEVLTLTQNGNEVPEARGARLLLRVREERNGWIYGRGAELRVKGEIRRPRELANPGVHSYREYLAGQGLHAELAASSPWKARVERWPSGWRTALARRAHQFAEWARARHGESAGLPIALAVGDRAYLDEQLIEDLRRTGASHVLAISGLHVGVAGAFFFFLARSLFLRIPGLGERIEAGKPAIVVALAAIATYAILSGLSESTQRAALMFAAAALALLCERRPSGLRALLLAATLIAAVEPQALASISFQLSFAAAGAIILAFRASDPVLRALGARGREADTLPVRLAWRGATALALILISSIAANLASWPLVAFYFNRVSLNGVIANLVVLPMVELALLPASLLALLGWWTYEPLGALALIVAARVAEFFAAATFAMADVLPLDWAAGSPAPAWIVLWLAALALAGWALADAEAVMRRAALAALVACALAGLLGGPDPVRAPFGVEVLDAGGGQVALARWNDGRRALVDTSRTWSDYPYVPRVVLPALAARGVREVDLLVTAISGPGAAAAALAYERVLAPGAHWQLERYGNAPIQWPADARACVRLIVKGPGRFGDDARSRGWAIALEGGGGTYLIEGAPGYWPTGWSELWRASPTVVQMPGYALRRKSTQWLLGRIRPALVVLPGRGGEENTEELPILRIAERGWTQLTFARGKVRAHSYRDQTPAPVSVSELVGNR